jgi:hypothetical protein
VTDPVLVVLGGVVVKTGDATRDLSWGGTQLYDRVLARCCAYILEIADKLPRFQTGALGELLKRDSQILARLEDVLARLPAPAANGSAGRPGGDRLPAACFEGLRPARALRPGLRGAVVLAVHRLREPHGLRRRRRQC